MIAGLRGVVEEIGTDHAIIDVGGVGYLAFCSGRTLGHLAIGEAAKLFVETHVREDHIHLYGFVERSEREWFKLLTTVQGVGARVALAILGVLSADELTAAIAASDKKAISRAPGVGPKLAGRIVAELQEKVGAIALGHAINPGAAPSKTPMPSEAAGATAVADAASALVNLGYGPAEALAAASQAMKELGDGTPVERLIPAALSRLAPSDLAAGE